MGTPWGPPWVPGPKIVIFIVFFCEKGPGGIPQAPEEPGEKIQPDIAANGCTRCRFRPDLMFFRHSPTAVFGLKTSRRLSAHPGTPWDPPWGPERPLWSPQRPLWAPERPLWAPQRPLWDSHRGKVCGGGRREPGAGRAPGGSRKVWTHRPPPRPTHTHGALGAPLGPTSDCYPALREDYSSALS